MYPNVKGYSNLNEALTDDYDGFIIASPAKTHFEIAKTLNKNKKYSH